ncbi:conserved hypothetical protein [Xenorhabdus nematophila str. Anatoliense]|nr:conserved hypothetical protein [Xenorhabdus nematophila str. Anatoliense]
MVEHDLAKVGVASSSLVSRSKKARWQSGHAADCKSVNLGSTPGRASILSPDGEIGRHKGFKIPRPSGCAGSSPALGTK